MTFKACKYGCNTQIQWDTELNAFRESDGKLHDRKRCEGLRPAGVSSQPQQQQPSQQTQQQTTQQTSVRTDVWLIPKDDWDKVQSNISNITHQLERLSEYYGDLLDHVRVMSRPIDKNEEAMAASEAGYDQAKEDGTLNV